MNNIITLTFYLLLSCLIWTACSNSTSPHEEVNTSWIFVANEGNFGASNGSISMIDDTGFVHETESQVILNGSYDVGFTMDLVCKDVGLFNKLADKYNIPAELSKLMNKIFTEGRLKYGDKSFSTSIVKKLEEACNENLRAPGFPSQLKDNQSNKKGIEIKF